MSKCRNCNSEISMGNMLECPNCGNVLCGDCAKKTRRICPKCYTDLEYIG